MSEKPIIICTELIPATMDGRKTVTRRIIGKTLGSAESLPNFELRIGGNGILESRCPPENIIWRAIYYGSDKNCKIIKAPYQKGDILWVKETWGVTRVIGMAGGKEYKEYPNILYKSDNSTKLYINEIIWKYNTEPLKWRSSRFMPKWAARIWLEVLDVRPERLQEITEEDAIKEGMYPEGYEIKLGLYADDPIEQFAQLWDSLNAKRGYSWKSNPWVERTEFERFERQEYFKQGS